MQMATLLYILYKYHEKAFYENLSKLIVDEIFEENFTSFPSINCFLVSPCLAFLAIVFSFRPRDI